MKPKAATGLAIPLVLGFILVAFTLGSTLVFSSRATVAGAFRLHGRLQHLHVTEMGMNEALSRIKPNSILSLRNAQGAVWRFQTPEKTFGKAQAWCEVEVLLRDGDGLKIVATGKWQEAKGSPPQQRILALRGRYRESRGLGAQGQIVIKGEWKFDRFQDLTREAPES